MLKIMKENKMIKLDRCSLDEEADLRGVVNREVYYTREASFLARTFQLRRIDKLLTSTGFKNYHHIPLTSLIGDWFEDINVQFPHCRRYYDCNNTRVEIKPTYGGYGEHYSRLMIQVGKEGVFEDYLWTCNLFRKFFGLKERFIGAK